jgi:hypothetical protein
MLLLLVVYQRVNAHAFAQRSCLSLHHVHMPQRTRREAGMLL